MAVHRALCPVLVGRDKELAELESALLDALRGHGQVLLLAGDAGLGKTRLASELADRARGGGARVLWGGCSEAELALPYLPFLEAIGNYLAGADQKLVGDRLGSLRDELSHLFPQVEDGRSRSTDDPANGKLRLFESILTVLRVAADEGGLLLVLEDLHWADSATRELLDYLVRRLPGYRILVLGTYRGDEMHRRHPLLPVLQAWRRSRQASVVELEALRPNDVAAMVTAIFDDPTKTDTRDFLYERSEGNPFVVEELLKSALDRGDIFRTEAGWRRRELSDVRLPETVRDSILLRVDRLDPEQIDVLRAASVLGASFEEDSLVELTATEPAAVTRALQASVLQQLVVEEATPGRYRFRHALTREAVYDDLLASQRQLLHGRAADVLGARGAVAPVELCRHLLAARRSVEAVPIGLEAARHAEATWALRDAAALYERLLPQIVDSRQLAEVNQSLGLALSNLGEISRAARSLEEAITGFRSLGDEAAVAKCRLGLGRCLWQSAQPDAAEAEYQMAREALEPMGPSADLATAYIRLSGLRSFDYRDQESRELAEKAIEVATAAGADAQRIWAYNFLGTALARLGAVDEGLAWLDRSFEDAAAGEYYEVAQNALHNQAALRGGLLMAREAVARIEAGKQRLAGRHQPWLDVPTATNLNMLGESEAARELLETLAQRYEGTGLVAQQDLMELNTADSLIQLGRLDEARQRIGRVPSRMEAQSRSGLSIRRARLELRAGQPEAALDGLIEPAPGWPAWSTGQLLDLRVAALIGVGRLAEARVAVAGLPTSDTGPRPRRVLELRALGRFAMAEGRHKDAISFLEASALIWADAGYRPQERWTRSLLADALAAAGRTGDAIKELRSVVESARAQHARLDEEEARLALGRLGEHVESEVQIASAAPAVSRGEKLITVLFADVRGYTALTHESPPAAIADRISAFHRWARREVEHNHGHVDKFVGDAVMAVFNLSGAHVDHALHALRAATALRDRASFVSLQLGAGIATGPAIVSELTENNMSVLGETINLASRLQAHAGAGEIILSEESYRRLTDSLGKQPHRDELQLKGFAAPVPAYRLEPD